MLPLNKKVDEESSFSHEIKWDGFRVLAYLEGEVILESRNGQVLNARFPQIPPALKTVGQALVLDGEVVALGKEGKPDFSLLKGNAAGRAPLLYVVFDLLFWRGKSICALPWRKRREILEDLLKRQEAVFLSPILEGDQSSCLELVTEAGLEGVVSKEVNSPYLPGQRSHYWRKQKRRRTLDCVVVGLRRKNGGVRSLCLALYNLDGTLCYVGGVGSGLGEAEMAFLPQAADLLARTTPAVINPPPSQDLVTWFEPHLVAEIEYLELTSSGKLRHPVFLRFRFDKEAQACLKGAEGFDG